MKELAYGKRKLFGFDNQSCQDMEKGGEKKMSILGGEPMNESDKSSEAIDDSYLKATNDITPREESKNEMVKDSVAN